MTSLCPCCGQAMPADELLILRDRNLVVRAGRAVRLTRTEMAVLDVLAARMPRCVNRGTIWDQVYQLADDAPELKIIDVMICKLRRKVEPLGLTLKTHWGSGVSLECDAPARRIVEVKAA